MNGDLLAVLEVAPYPNLAAIDGGAVGNRRRIDRGGDRGRAGRGGRGQGGRVGSVKIVGDRSEGTKVGVEQDGVAAGGQVIPKAVFELDCDGGGRDAVGVDRAGCGGDGGGGRRGAAEGAAELLAANRVEGGRGGRGDVVVVLGGNPARRAGDVGDAHLVDFAAPGEAPSLLDGVIAMPDPELLG